MKQHSIEDLYELYSSWFCSPTCGEQFSSLMQYIKNGEQEIAEFFKEVIKEKHALVCFHKKLHIRWRIINCKFAPGRETTFLLSNVVGILDSLPTFSEYMGEGLRQLLLSSLWDILRLVSRERGIHNVCLLVWNKFWEKRFGVQLMVLPTIVRAQPMWLLRFKFTKVARKQAMAGVPYEFSTMLNETLKGTD
ncbi:hypothetical protein L195_g043910 [Trifolium pratense]|uniref:Uncharacterized protein n=1 Tax=Trifolium pratense TaxID=57577 RepID=A0A2K3MAL5_TRIPR|nr:hypothetical protein L195_g043910 [Trifolium pratense]